MMDRCPACNTPYKSSQSMFCTNCGAARLVVEQNYCTNPRCPNHGRPVDRDARYCDLCGSLTLYGKKIDGLF